MGAMASTPRAPVNPAVLRWAREDAGFDVDTLARRAQTKPARLLAWETGELQPTLRQLHNIAWALRRPPAFFFRQDLPPSDIPQPPDFRRAEEVATVSVELRRELRLAAQRRSRLLELVESIRPFSPDVAMDDPDSAASRARSVLGVSVEDQFSSRDAYQAMHLWVRAIERLHAVVFQTTAFGLDVARGASVYFDTLPVILVNAKDPIVARSFTLLHEFGHLCMGSGAVCDVYGRRLPAVETRCNRFAAAVLMPPDAFLDALGDDAAAQATGRLARKFKVSEEAAAIRLFELQRLSRAELDRVREETRLRVEERSEDESPIVPYSTRRLRDLGRSYVGAVLDAYHDDRITLTDVSQYLDVKVSHIPKMEEALERSSGSLR